MPSAHVVSKSSARVILVSMKCGEERASPKTVLMLTPCLRGEGPRTEHQRLQLTNILSLFTENGAPGTSRRQVIEDAVFTAEFPLLPSALIPLMCTTVQSHSSKDGSASKPRRLANQLTTLIERAASRSPFGTTCV